METIDRDISIDFEDIKDFLKVKFDKFFLNKKLESDNKSLLFQDTFGYDNAKRWIRETPHIVKEKNNSILGNEPKKKVNPDEPSSAEKILNLAGFLDLDPFLFFQINYENWGKFLKSLDGNISMANIINFGKIHPNLKFLDFFFSPLTTFPSPLMLKAWNYKRPDDEKSGWENVNFKSDLKNGETKKEQMIFIKPSKNNQVIHFSYNKNKPLKSLELWQEYKLIFIRPIEDIMYFLSTTEIWNSKTEKEKLETAKEMDLILVLNILGGVCYDFVPKREPFLVKTRFEEEKTQFKVSSAHNFEFSLVQDNKDNFKTIFENPC